MSITLEVKGLKKGFGKNRAVENVSLKVKAGEIFGFLGPNGAGKTTTLRCIMNFLTPDAGTIKVLGADSVRDSVAVKRLVGYVPSDHHLVGSWSGAEHIDYVARLRGAHQRPEALIQQLGLDIHRKVKQLSTGNKQKLSIILGFIGEPQLLLLDEPTQGLDPLFQSAVYELLEDFRKQGRTVFVSSHNLPEVQRICDRVGIIRAGELVADESLASLREKSKHVIRARFAKPVPKDLFVGGPFTVITSDKHMVEVSVRGSLDPAMKILAKHSLLDLEVTHASLEEIFMEMYQ